MEDRIPVTERYGEMATSAREARRRKIVERGSDRLALITGQIRTLPSSSSSSSQSQHSHTVSSPPLLFQDQDLQTHLSNQTNGEDDAPGIALLKNETSNGSVRSAAVDTNSRVEPQLQKCATSIDTTRTPALDNGNEGRPSLLSARVQNSPNSTVDTEPHPHTEPQPHHPRIFTANQIRSSISATENIRILCSVTIALLVVLSHLSLPLVGSKTVRSIITSRPLYLLLLTDITIVLARLLLVKQGGSMQTEARRAPTEDEYGWAEGVGKALEMGLVLHKAINAAFMDCSVYAVIVVSGLSLVNIGCIVNILGSAE